MRKPARTVEYGGKVYKVRGNVEVPALHEMDTLAALIWLNRNTYARGYQRAANPLTGMGGAISVSTR